MKIKILSLLCIAVSNVSLGQNFTAKPCLQSCTDVKVTKTIPPDCNSGYRFAVENNSQTRIAVALYAEKKDGGWLSFPWIYLMPNSSDNPSFLKDCELTGKYVVYYAPKNAGDQPTFPDDNFVKSTYGKKRTRVKPVLDNGQCIKITKKFDKACNTNSDIVVTIKNACSDASLDGKVFIEKKDGTWSSGYFSDLAPNKTNSSFWTCNSTGKVIVFRSKHGTASLEDYPSEAEVKEKFGTRKYGYGEH